MNACRLRATSYKFRRAAVLLPAVMSTIFILGCEGIGRKHDTRVLDIQPPPEDTGMATAQPPSELPNFPDLVEQMLANRLTLLSVRNLYFEQLLELERAYLLAGDSVKANWARHQRERLEEVDVEPYPYLTAAPPEHRAEVAPEELIPEADEIFNNAYSLLKEIRTIPAAGFLGPNKKKAQKALGMFKRVLREYPTSDKVDDCAFCCGELYKEYLRDDDPDNELAIRYYKWAYTLDPQTPHAARFQCAVVYDFRRHDRTRAIELYHQVLETEENGNLSNQRFAASRIEQLTDDEFSHLRPQVGSATVTPASHTDENTEQADPPMPDDTGTPVTANIQNESAEATEPTTP